MAIDAIAIGISGLRAAEKRLEISANNVANFQSTTTLQNGEVVNNPYQPGLVQQVSVSPGGTQAVVQPVDPATIPLFDPSNVAANDQGVVQYPNVDLAQETVNQILAAREYEANLRVIKAGDELLKNTIDIVT